MGKPVLFLLKEKAWPISNAENSTLCGIISYDIGA